MKYAENLYHLIELYLAHEMSAEELADFERRMRENPELRAEITLHKELEETINEDEIRDFSALLHQVNKDYFAGLDTQATVKPLFQRFGYISIAAVIAAVFGLYFLLQPPPPPTAEGLFTANYEPLKMRLAVRGDSISDLENKAKEAYQNQNYSDAIAYLSELEQTRPTKVDYTFYKGISFLGLHQADEAIVIFDAIIGQPQNSAFVPCSQWYRGLALLDKGNIPEARRAFQTLVDDPQHFYRKKAQNILQSLSAM